MLSRSEGLTSAELAAQFGVSEKAVERRMARTLTIREKTLRASRWRS